MERHDVKTVCLKECIQPITESDNVEEIYLFGSRAYKTCSFRSDIDVLIYAPKGISQYEANKWFERENALDVFESVDKINARSLVNDSRITRKNLINKLDAVLVWSKEKGFTNEVDQFSDMKILKYHRFEKSILPTTLPNTEEFQLEYGEDAIFMIMPFKTEYKTIYQKIKTYMGAQGYKVIRADEKWFLTDVWPNVRLYLECCKRAIALFPNEPKYNANVALEVGYMMCKGSPVLLLKEKGDFLLFSDIISRMFEEYDLSKLDEDLERILDSWIKRGLK